jgi:hypothetical protein
MKFNKLMHVAVSSATVLSALAVAAPAVSTFAAEHPEQADTLPQTAKTKVGISFGNTTDTGHTGYLRLQYVPTVLDFGNHESFGTGSHNYTADGIELASNETSTGYKGGNNQTQVLNTSDTGLSDVNGKVWATVVDKSGTATKTDADGTTSNYGYGDWNLKVSSDNKLAKTDDNNVQSTTDVLDGTLGFTGTKYGQTDKVKQLTNDAQDDTFAPSTTAKAVSSISDSITLPLDGTGDANAQTVATAAEGQGQGANVFGWSKSNVTLTLPSTSVVNNGIYTADLTWTLSTGI